jgi:pyrroloquinoline quinone (PQQ) biosynthesis protein C
MSLTGHPRSVRARRETLTATPHPQWATRMLERLRPDWNAVLESEVFAATRPGAFPVEIWSRILFEFFCVVESFPKYMGVTLAKTTFGQSPKDELARTWLIGNIRVEARHVEWYIDWAAGHGIGRGELIGHRPNAAVGALDSWLWSVAYRGSLAEAVGAINYAIEGTTGEWTRRVLPVFTEHYDHDKTTLAWIVNHAEYDDKHPVQALEIVKNALSADGVPPPSQIARTEDAIRRTLRLFRAGLDSCARGRGGPLPDGLASQRDPGPGSARRLTGIESRHR